MSLTLGVQLLEQVPDRIGLFLVVVGLKKRTLGREVADVAVAGIAHRAEAEHRFVATVARAEDIFARRRRRRRRGQNCALASCGGIGSAGDSQHRRGEIDRFEQAIVDTAGREVLGGRGKLFGQRMMSGTCRPAS